MRTAELEHKPDFALYEFITTGLTFKTLWNFLIYLSLILYSHSFQCFCQMDGEIYKWTMKLPEVHFCTVSCVL